MNVWDQLVGQPQAVKQLRRAAASEAVPHAWLFTGPPGSGRSVAARALAAGLLCERPDPSERGCGECKSCRTAMSGTHADVTNFATENVSIKIEEARELVVKAQDRPAVGRWRILVVEDADRMPERTSNVLLKAIEEPPPHTVWLLCAPSPIDVLVTIRSRCRAVNLKVPGAEEVAELLERRDGVPSETALRAARLAQGHIGIARRLAMFPDAKQRREDVVRLPLGLDGISSAVAAAERLISTAEAEAAADAEERNEREKNDLLVTLGAPESGRVPPTVKAAIRRLEEDQKRRARRIQVDTLDRFLIDLTTFFRDVLTLQLKTGSLLINHHLERELGDYALNSSAERTLEQIDTINLTRRRISTNVNPRLAFEAMAASLIQRH
ncbi:DNA polymerase III subunit delta' [Kocuria sp. HSID16901]|uniref:DNA polymerase III subunit delta' n=1 Tax=Kocuria sp. HSID16901 TaxID=2419505 RepID=UPI00065FA085|nr:DNA polymerase III subunit delta' [Kocuria sp. HSID16901]RUQ20934.1 DNA polymerase III subunit delta' [Kocuria sp. HSID16901]